MNKEIINENVISIYPNPSYNYFNIESKKNSVIEIYNIFGEQILSEKVNAGIYKLYLNEQPKGLYFLKYTTENQSRTIRLIKE
jgi:hypothetical protein